jgi:hypothetical protein
MGRYPAPFAPTERPPPRGIILGFRANEREREILRELAAAAGMTTSEFVRTVLAERVRQLSPEGV